MIENITFILIYSDLISDVQNYQICLVVIVHPNILEGIL